MNKKPIEKIQEEFKEGMGLAKCRKCGCMKEALDNLQSFLPKLNTKETKNLLENVNSWKREMESIKYSCLGCEYCFPAEATNIINETFPEQLDVQMSCGFEIRDKKWFPVTGEYFEFCEGESCPVAVSTLEAGFRRASRRRPRTVDRRGHAGPPAPALRRVDRADRPPSACRPSRLRAPRLSPLPAVPRLV